jgi:oligoendopeptidase F
VARLREINDRFHADQGADPVGLGVRYDLETRAGKTPVAFTQFGSVPRRTRGLWRPAEAWVLATYREGGFDNLVELLHETGHAVHITAIEARPAFADWPDADPLTEALGDLMALEAYEPAWQLRYLGDSARAAASLRAKYAGIVLDVAWALFEIRLHEDPALDPSAVWADLTGRYLRIVPHPELPWWALRAQLVDAPGYMANYALGAIVAAGLRSRARALWGPFHEPDRERYARLSGRLYRFGLGRPARIVVRDFLGGAPGADALLADLRRLGGR